MNDVTVSMQDWLRKDRTPADYYELLGVPRLEPSREMLLDRIRTLTRELITLQNATDDELERRVTHLQLELAKADDVFQDTKKHADYDENIVDKVREQLASTRGSTAWSPQQLREWLVREQHVHRDRLEDTIKAIGPACPAASEMYLVTKTEEENASEPQSYNLVPEPSTNLPPTPRPGVFTTPKSPSDDGPPVSDFVEIVPEPDVLAPESTGLADFWSSPAGGSAKPTSAMNSPAATPTIGPAASVTRTGPIVVSRRKRWIIVGGVAVAALLVFLNVALIALRMLPHSTPRGGAAAGQSSVSLGQEPKTRVPQPPRDNRAGSASSTPVPPEAAVPPEGPLNQKSLGSNLLIVSEEGTAAIRRDQGWQLLDMSGKAPSRVIWGTIDSNGGLWLCGEGGASRLNGETIETFTDAEGLPVEPLSHVFEDSQNRIWIGSWGGGVAMRAPGQPWQRLTVADGLRHPDINGCVEDYLGRIWIAGDAEKRVGGKGVTLYSGGVLEPEGIGDKLALNVMSLDGDSEGRVFLGCIGGLFILHPNRSIKRIQTDDGLPQQTPQATYIDRQGRIWLGTWGGGVVQVDHDSYEVLSENALPEAEYVRRITEDDRGTIWVGATQGLWQLSDQQWQEVSLPPEIQDVMVVATVPKDVVEQLIAWCESS